MKYIDAEKLIAEIERLNSIVPYENNDRHDEGLHDAYKAVKNVIGSLQQEREKKSEKNCNSCPHCIDRKDQYGWYFKGCFGGPYKGKFIAEIDECPLKQEQPEVDLEKEIKHYIKENFTITDEIQEIPEEDRMYGIDKGDMLKIAHYFYSLGLNTKKK